MPPSKKVLILLLFLVLQSGAGIIGAAVALDSKYTDVIQQGVTVKGIQLGGLSRAEALLKLQNALPPLPDQNLTISNEERISFINLHELDGSYDYLSSVNEALSYGKTGGALNRLISVLRLKAAPVDLKVSINFSEGKLSEKIKSIQTEWDTPPGDAEIKLVNGSAAIIPEKKGYRLDFEKTLERARQALARGDLAIAAAGQVLEPAVTAADLEEIRILLSEYVTFYDPGDQNRAHNIAVASAAINATLLKPGEIFSLNQKLGPRLAETGYLKAPVYIGGRLAQDIGGGVCQVATTLYNAVLLADLAVVERHPHPKPVAYVPIGLDATIAGDYYDLKFMNNLSSPVYLSSTAEGGKLTVRIFGAVKKEGCSVRITSESTAIDPDIVTYHDDTLPEGETRIKHLGKAGYKAWVYRELIVDNQVVSKTLISSDYYESEDRVIVTGKKAKENPPGDEDK
ncbi:Uncharacterized vancomycin resistance protein [Pelotomaculum thermopropionicum SI]|uniref:Uncharacterized vancomycin resistance protein n=1 Tax=Pelotomaculum thermopropionicum (strain DSM 13744 / JCM 10971 / SI) TaxID=370438 RepID=A5D499_PELTS|nr:Uncharacterized vancomycin resistance protein [Pelotomaculum thermopropionicum SI]